MVSTRDTDMAMLWEFGEDRSSWRGEVRAGFQCGMGCELTQKGGRPSGWKDGGD